ncbi:MAG: ABC transporter substrate-binding protein [Xanthobacteraceae bacterium]
MRLRSDRRKLITLASGAAAIWPFRSQAQQPPMPAIGFLTVGPPAEHLTSFFRQALAELGYVDGGNVAIEYRHADNQYERLPALAHELVQRRVSVIAAITTPPAVAVHAVTQSVPLVFMVADDPVKLGLVASVARPGGHATGVNFLFSDLGAKQLGLLREVVPRAARVGLLVNPHNSNAEPVRNELRAAATNMTGVEIIAVEASDSREIEAAFASLIRDRADALVVGTDPFFFRRRVQITTLATRYGLPAIYNARDYSEAGGLISYGTSLTEAFRLAGIYTGRILKGDKTADLPVVQSTKFVFVINLPTAHALGIEISPLLLARADEVIE